MKRKRYSFKKIDYKNKNHEPLQPLFKHQLLITCLSILSVVLITLGTSLAVFSKTANGNEYNVVQVGELQLSYADLNEEGNVLKLNNDFPVSDSVGSAGSAYRFSVENTGTLAAKYTVKIINDEDTITADGCSDKLLNVLYVRYQFDNGTIGTLSDLLSSDGTSYIIHSGTLQSFESNIHEIKLWLTETSPNSVLGTHYHGKVVIDIEQGEGTNAYERPTPPSVSTTPFETLGENCKTYNDGTDTFLTGQCANNYVWYSGKLWRVVLKNNQTGAVKMVTDNAITVIPYNASGNTAFENSYMDQWLNQEFLPTLHDTSQFLVENSVWDATTNSSDTPARPTGTTTVQRTVGLLNSYEYYTTYNNSDGIATSSTGYLNNKAGGSYGIYWWLLTPYGASDVRYVIDNGSLYYYNPTSGYGARPSVNLKSSIQIESGTGTQSNPYILKGDTQETINGTTLISTRYSGEYITFNNELYRIVGVETVNGEQLTKITAVDKPSALASNSFHSASYVRDFASAAIKTDLKTYYQGLATSNITAYNMIQPSTMWYLGTVGYGVNYKASICSAVDESKSMQECSEKATSTTANIGLPRVGEMFTSQITRGSRTDFWTLTPYSSSSVWYVNDSGLLNSVNPTKGYGARLSMYLKSTIKIASNNTGNGTYEKPYAIE